MGQAFMTRRGGGGKKLPELDLPAIASHIVEGYEAINGEGEKMVGTLGSNITKPATAAQIASGYQAINGLGELINGTGTLATYAVQTGTLSSKASGSITAPGTILLVLCEGSDHAGGTTPNAGKQVMTHWYSSSSSTSVRKFVMSVSGKTFTYDGSANSSTATTYTYYIVYKV